MNNDLELWKKATEHLKGILNPDVFSRWIEIMSPVAIKNNCFILNVENDFYQDWIEKNYKSFILDALTVAGAPIGLTVKIEVLASNPDLQSPPPKPEPHPEPPKKPRKKASNLLASPLNPTFTFENFVTGPSNSFAHAAAMGVSQAPGRAYNPLFIHGPTGIGKTHLMQAVGHLILQKPGMSVCYVSSETLLNEYIDALRNRTIIDFRNRYRRADVLLVDDIQFLGGKDNIQEEFFHTFNALKDAGKQIIVTCDVPPQDLKGIEPRLISRFEGGGGMPVEIENPKFETRLAILEYKNSLAPVQLNKEILTFIAHNIESNVRSLEGALMRTVAFASLNSNLVITTDMLKVILKDQLNDEYKKDLTCDEIQRAVVSHFELRIVDMSSKTRTQAVAEPRQIAMFLCRKLTRLSLPEIAQRFDKEHPTVSHACKKIQNRIQVDNDLLNSIKQIVQALGRDPSSINL